jgi:hypothetical protein
MSTMRLCPSSTAPVNLDLNQLSDLLYMGSFCSASVQNVGSDKYGYWYGISYEFLVVLNVFHQCFVQSYY